MIRAIPDPDGWVHTLIVQEVAPEWAPTIPPGEVLLDAMPAVELPLLRLDAAGRPRTPHDDRVAWRRLRSTGLSGPEAVGQARHRDLGGLPDAGPDATPVAPAGGFSHDFKEVPGLRLRPLTVDDLELMASGAIASGIQAARCPDDDQLCCRPPEAHAWLRLADRIDREDTWQLVLEFDGVPLQMELLLVDGDQALFSYTAHFTRERPHWFWREAERPVFERLKAAGVTRLTSRTRNDRPDWIQALKDNYGAVEDGAWDAATVRLRFDSDAAFERMSGWPARKTAGPDWSFERAGVRVVEAPPADVRLVIEGTWGFHPRKRLALRMLDEWYRLDRGTVLLASTNGNPGQVRIIRHRRDVVGSIGVLTPYADEPAEEHVVAGLNAWMLAAGYTKASGFVPVTQWDNLRVMQHADMARWTVVKIHDNLAEPFVEIERDLAP